MKNTNQLILPKGIEIENSEAYTIYGGGILGAFKNQSVGELANWVFRKFGYSNVATFFLATGLNYTMDYVTALNTLRKTNPEAYQAYSTQMNKHQYCCNGMHAFDGLCPGNPYYK